ncbi:MAG: hypothetical protein ABJN95_01395 [Maribacter sp.]
MPLIIFFNRELTSALFRVQADMGNFPANSIGELATKIGPEIEED